MRVFLAGIPLEGARVVVIGGGEAALAKLRLFVGSPADLVWFAPGDAPGADRRPQGAPSPFARTPTPEDLAGARLVFVALDDEAEASRVAGLARAAGAQVNVVDRPGLSDFQTPALIDRDQVVIGVATGGAAPILARDVRARIEGVLPEALGPLAALAGRIRERVKAGAPDFLARRRFWEKAFRGAAADMVAEGRIEAAHDEMIRLLDAAAPGAGVVHLLGSGTGDPELLTLKALRILQDADVILHDAGVPPGVLARARRDAPRRDVSAMTAPEVRDLIAGHLAQGERVVRLYVGDPGAPGPAACERGALKDTGVEAFVIPVVPDPRHVWTLDDRHGLLVPGPSDCVSP
ncbi:NAD(P)-dependent oxidoreductase [Brevundimonas sp.]|uniref:NAD(P)-dependent oxidoreductase n=1 Tax=Brevundimonas sp. TaxID=1871086 RepID=UPI002737BA97|nr:NAD(P)-dependent oxidoreductase [Brevundimonas sp.]MDP3803225.1 NAD(P)-dependent oxidoreductase [Brevundimonas sp.]